MAVACCWSKAISAADRLGRKQAAATLRERLSTLGIPPGSPFYAKVLGWWADL